MQRSALSAVAWMMYVSLGYGVLSWLRGVFAGHDIDVALKELVIHIYPMFFFVAIWVGRRDADLLPKIIRCLAWFIGIYGTVFVFVLSPLHLVHVAGPPPVMGMFTQPMGVPVVILGLISFQPNLGRIWLPLVLNLVVFLGLQVRAAWLGFLVCFSAWGVLSGRIGSVYKLLSLILVVFVVGFVTDVRVPSPGRRGGELSARNIVAQIAAPVSPEFASRWATKNVDASAYSNTVSWRTEWWMSIIDETHSSPLRTVFGAGYGVPIWNLHPMDLPQDRLRTPHNIFVFLLGNTGWLGVVIFYGFQLSLAVVMWRVYRKTGQPFGLCLWVMIIVWSLFDNYFEAPQGAIPFYLLLGLAASPLVFPTDQKNKTERC